MTILVTGAAGGVGLTASRYLAARAQTVRALVAPWSDGDRIRALASTGIQVVTGDVRERADVARALDGVHAVVHAAALLPHDGQAAPTRAQQYEVNVRGSENVLRSAHAAGVGRAIFVSTAGVASHQRPGAAPDDETAPYRAPQNDHVWSKIEAEKAITRTSRELACPVVILRPVTIYGTGMVFRWPGIFRRVQRGTMLVIDRGRAPYPLIHAEDFARAIECALALPALERTEAVIVDSDESFTIGEIVRFIARYLHAPPPRSVPHAAAYGVAWAVSRLPRRITPARLADVTPARIREYVEGHAYRNDKAKRVLGFRARVPFASGMAEMLDDFLKRSSPA